MRKHTDTRATYTESEAHELLIQTIRAEGTQSDFARKHQLTNGYVCDLVAHRRGLSERILEILGMEREVTVTYRKIGEM